MTATLLGIIVGLVLGLSGTGGGIIAVPLLVLGLKMSIPQAVPISLMAVGMAAGVGAAMGLKQGIVRYKAAALMAITGIVFAPAGLWIAKQLHTEPLTAAFACLLLVLGYRTYSRAGQQTHHEMTGEQLPCMLGKARGKFVWSMRCARALSISGAGTGLLSGLLGVGGGFILVPAMQRFTNLPMQSIIATSLAVITLVALAGIATSAAYSGIAWHYAVPFTGGAVAGMAAGRMFSRKLAAHHLQRAFALVVIGVALGLVVKIGMAWL
ncbi:MAG TPA: sulfite exporter TauE/SafE family protein [Methylophilaceae bacterium]|nr:sulfite exporter TauE/SafE family protein [Methylophilaceae bacterium]